MNFKIKLKDLEDVTKTVPTKLFYNNKWNKGTAQRIEETTNFTKFRNMLEKKKFIIIQPQWWNGDVVLKPFKVNNFKFKTGEIFPCSFGLKIKLACVILKPLKKKK